MKSYPYKSQEVDTPKIVSHNDERHGGKKLVAVSSVKQKLRFHLTPSPLAKKQRY